jgi:drug/metabolite transporter (DMT)-like permease
MVATRELSAKMSLFEIMFFRNSTALLFLSPFLARIGVRGLATEKFKLHASRAVIQFGAQYSWVYGVALLPIAEVMALEFSIPIWVALLAIPFLRETMPFHKWAATALGFAGVLIILRPGLAVVQPAALIVLAGCIAFAANHVMIKYLTRTESALVIVFYINVCQLPLSLVPSLFTWVTPDLTDVPWILMWGGAGLLGNYCMARALKLADATLLAPVDFLRLPATALAGYLVYREALDPLTALGAVVIFAGNYYSVRHETRRSKA